MIAANSSDAVLLGLEQLADVLGGAAQRLHRRDALQRVVARQVEDHRVPRGGGDVLGELGQTHAAEVGAGVVRRVRDGSGDLVLGDESLHAPRAYELVVEPLVQPDVVILHVDQVQLGVVPVEPVALAVALEQRQLGDPVELADAFHRIAGEPYEDALPPFEDVVGLLVGAFAGDECLGELEVGTLDLQRGHRADRRPARPCA